MFFWYQDGFRSCWLLIEMCLGQCCFGVLVHVCVRAGMPQQGHYWVAPSMYQCHCLQDTCLSEGLQPWGNHSPETSKTAVQVLRFVEIYWDVAEVLSGTEINRVIHGDWFGFWKLISNGWYFLFFYPLWKRSWAITNQWWHHLAKPAAFLYTKQAIQIPAFMKMGATCFYLFPLMLTRCSTKLRHGSLIQQLLACSIQAPGVT